MKQRNPYERAFYRPETDTGRIIKRHLQNKHDVITEDDIRNVRIGAGFPSVYSNESSFNHGSAGEAHPAGRNAGTARRDEPLTPWDLTA